MATQTLSKVKFTKHIQKMLFVLNVTNLFNLTYLQDLVKHKLHHEKRSVKLWCEAMMSYSRPIGNIGLIILRDMLDVHIVLSAVHPYFATAQ